MARTVDPAKHAARRAHIRDAAAGVFAERGFDGASTEAIRTAAGVGSGTLFHYFGDKRSIMVEIFTVSQAGDAAFVASLDECVPLAELRRLLDHVLDGAEHPAAGGLVLAMMQLATRDEEFAGLLDRGDEQLRAALARLVAAAQRQGVVRRDLEPARAARWLLGLTDTLYLMLDGRLDVAAEIAELHRIASRYLGADEGVTG